jgi:hypothetical protein
LPPGQGKTRAVNGGGRAVCRAFGYAQLRYWEALGGGLWELGGWLISRKITYFAFQQALANK